MLRLVYSNRTEELARIFAEDLARHWDSGEGDPFDPAEVIVPNRNIEAYLKFALAREHGIAANLQFHLLQRFLHGAMARGRSQVRFLDADRTTGLLLSVFLDEGALAHDDLADVRRYLFSAGTHGEAVELRRVALAKQLARLFEEYTYNRLDMLRAWPSGPLFEGTVFGTTERWQRRLYLDIFEPGGRADRQASQRGEEWYSLPRLLDPTTFGSWELPPRLFLFGLSYVSSTFHALFGRMAQASDLTIYTLNPCMEFWEDVGPAFPKGRHREKGRFPPRGGLRTLDDGLSVGNQDPFGLDVMTDPTPLRLWGKPGRENIRLLNELADCDFEGAFVDPVETDGNHAPLLLRIQRNILTRAAEIGDAPQGGMPSRDDSLQIFACPTPRREAEAVVTDIWRLLREGAQVPGRNPLRMNDIAVVVAGRHYSQYVAHLETAFTENHQLTYHLVDLPFLESSALAEGATRLLALPSTNFSRTEVMRVLGHPCVLSRYRDLSLEDWRHLPDSLGIVQGIDAKDLEGTYLPKDVVHWDQGLKRLALGAFLETLDEGEERCFRTPNGRFLPVHRDWDQATSFGALARSLLADARFAKGAQMTMTAWASFFRTLLQSYLIPRQESEERELHRCVAALADLEAIDTGEHLVSYRLASELALGQLRGLSTQRGSYLADGVVVAPFLPMRAIPFRAVYILGLGEKDFPGAERTDPLDLRAAKRRPGDVNVRDQDRYLFLETLLCTRERLTLSYVARDPMTGDALEPSPVIAELRAMLDRAYLDSHAKSHLIRRIPFRRHTEGEQGLAQGTDATFGLSENALSEARASLWGRHVRPLATVPSPRWNEPHIRTLLEAAGADPNTTLGWHPLAAAAGTSTERQVPSLTLSNLRRFLECPLQGYARFRLQLAEDDAEDVLEAEDEPLALARRDLDGFLQQVFATARRQGRPLKATYDELRERRELQGKAPLGPFAVAERKRHLAVLESWHHHAHSVLGESFLPTLRFGRADEHGPVDRLEPGLRLRLNGDGAEGAGSSNDEVTLVGKTGPLGHDLRSSWLFVSKSLTGTKAEGGYIGKKLLQGLLDHAVLVASRTIEAGPFAVYICSGEPSPKGLYVAELPAWNAEEAQAYLESLCCDFLLQTHGYLLPCEGVISFLANPDMSLQEHIAKVRDGYDPDQGRGVYSSVYGPLRHPETYPLPLEEDARAMVQRRFGPILALLGAARPESRAKDLP